MLHFKSNNDSKRQKRTRVHCLTVHITYLFYNINGVVNTLELQKVMHER